MLLVNYYIATDGVLSIKSIGFYVAVISILVTILKTYTTSGSLLKNVGSVMQGKAAELQHRLSEAARAESSKSKQDPESDSASTS